MARLIPRLNTNPPFGSTGGSCVTVEIPLGIRSWAFYVQLRKHFAVVMDSDVYEDDGRKGDDKISPLELEAAQNLQALDVLNIT